MYSQDQDFSQQPLSSLLNQTTILNLLACSVYKNLHIFNSLLGFFS